MTDQMLRRPPADEPDGDRQPAVVSSEPVTTGPRRPRSEIAGPAAFGWRWIFPLVMLGIAAAVPYLVIQGGNAVLDSSGGVVTEARIDDPTEPGYVAFVLPSPTALTVFVDGDGEAVGASFIGLAGERQGGTVIQLPAELLVPTENGESETIAAAYAGGGVDRVAAAITTLFGVDADEVIELGPDEIVAEVLPGEPYALSLADQLVDVSASGAAQVLYERGVVDLTAADVPAVLAAIGPSEAGINRTDRQSEFWRTWIQRIRRSDAPAESVLAEDRGLGRYLLGLSSGTFTVETIAADQGATLSGEQLYEVTDEVVADAVARAVPFPRLVDDVRPSVQVENGNGDFSSGDIVAELVSDGGGHLTLVSNAPAFTVQTTTVEVHDENDLEVGEELARLFGAEVVLQVDPESNVAIVITLGSDFVAPGS